MSFARITIHIMLVTKCFNLRHFLLQYICITRSICLYCNSMLYIHKPYTFFEIIYINVVLEKRTTIPFTNYMLFDNAIFVYERRWKKWNSFSIRDDRKRRKGRVCKRSKDTTGDNKCSEREGSYKSYAYFFCKKEKSFVK